MRAKLFAAVVLFNVAAVATAEEASDSATEDYICKTSIEVQYTAPAAGEILGPIVLGRGQNGAVISLYPGVFDVRCEIWVCNASTDAMHPDPAFIGASTVDYTTNTGQDRNIVLYAIDVRTPVGLSPFEQNFAPIVTSIEINPRTASIGETVTVKATGYEINGGGDFLRSMGLEIFDNTAFEAGQGRGRRSLGPDHVALRSQLVDLSVPEKQKSYNFEFTPRIEDFTDSAESAHRLVGRATATDNFGGLEGYGDVPFIVNRLEAVQIGAVAFNRPRVSLDINKQTHAADYSNGDQAAVVKLDIFDPDAEFPPVVGYDETSTYRIEFFRSADVPGYTGGRVPSPNNCLGEREDDGCSYTECACNLVEDADGNLGCPEIEANRIGGVTGDEWTFTWNPWANQRVTNPAAYGITFCQFQVHFVDNTASARRLLPDGVTQTITEGLITSSVSILLQANPGSSVSGNYPPTIRFFYATHVELDLSPAGRSTNTTVSVTFEDADSGRPDSALGYAADGNVTCRSSVRLQDADCFRSFAIEEVERTDADLGAWQDVWTINGAAAVQDVGSVRVFLRLRDPVTEIVSYHRVATLISAVGRRRRQSAATDAVVPATTAMSIMIDENGRLSGEMEFPGLGVNAGVDVEAGDTAGDGTAADDDDSHGDDHVYTDDVSSDRLLVIILALAGVVVGCCLLGAAACIVAVLLRRSGNASIGPSPTRRPTKILVSEAAPGLDGRGRRRTDPFVGFRMS